MPSQGPNSGATFANVTVNTIDWHDVSNAAASDNSRAYNDDDFSNSTDYIRITNFGFSLPSGAVVVGVTVEVEGYTDVSGCEWVARLLKTSGPTGFGKNVGIALSESYETMGGPADTWSATLTDADVNSSDFGVDIRGAATFNGPATMFYIDHVRVTVDYAMPGNPNSRQSQLQPILAQ